MARPCMLFFLCRTGLDDLPLSQSQSLPCRVDGDEVGVFLWLMAGYR